MGFLRLAFSVGLVGLAFWLHLTYPDEVWYLFFTTVTVFLLLTVLTVWRSRRTKQKRVKGWREEIPKPLPVGQLQMQQVLPQAYPMTQFVPQYIQPPVQAPLPQVGLVDLPAAEYEVE